MEYRNEEQEIGEDMCHLRRMAPESIVENLLNYNQKSECHNLKKNSQSHPTKWR